MDGRRVGRDDVAAEAGVSGATVSYVLNGQAAKMRIAPATEQRVRDAAARLGYVAHGAARELRRGRTDRLGVIVWLGQLSVWAQSLLAYNTVIRRSGHQLLLVTHELGEPLNLVVQSCLEQTDGAIVQAGTLTDDDVPGLREAHKPVVVVNDWALAGVRTVVSSVGAMVEQTTAHLIAEGWRDLLLADRLPHCVDGFRRALEAAGLPFDQEMTHAVGYHSRVGYEWATRLGAAASGRGIVASTDAVAMGIMSALSQVGLRAGRDYGLTGLHSDYAANWLEVPLTTARQPYDRTAEAALELLLGAEPGAAITVPGELVVRASSRRG